MLRYVIWKVDFNFCEVRACSTISLDIDLNMHVKLAV